MGKIVIVLARCSHFNQSFGIRFEDRGESNWFGTWAFAIKESAAHKEGYDKTVISGAFNLDDGYPGCPHCQGKSVYKCVCGKVACWDGESEDVVCPWCGYSGKVVVGNVESLSAGTDR